VQGFKPGEHFHYCNAGFDILGLLAAKLDGKPWRKCVQARILDPLEMTATQGVITTSSRALQATGYEPFWMTRRIPARASWPPRPTWSWTTQPAASFPPPPTWLAICA